MNLQLEIAILEFCNQHGIVKVTRGFAVDGHNRQGTKIAPPMKFAQRNDRGRVLRLLEGASGKVMRQVKLPDGDFNIYAEVILAAEDLDDSSSRILCRRGPVSNFDVDHNTFQIIPPCSWCCLFPQHTIH